MKRQSLLSTTTLTLFLLTTAGAAFAAPAADLADVNLGSGQIDFAMKTFEAVTLTVTGPEGFSFQSDFAAGETPIMNRFDKAKGMGPGTYNWSLTVNGSAPEGERSASGGLAARTQSGVFTVQADGSIADPNLVEGGSFTKDQVILDDLIVDGSICAGFDCVNGESFGFDTIRMKENNLRLRADDTSNSASFPSNDWQLTFNDTSNGGANKFSVDDVTGGRTPFTIEASAPSHSLYVEDGGRIGIGTSTPVVSVHVKGGNTPTLRLEQDGSSGFTPQTWDMAGNEANFFIRDATNGSTLPLQIKPGAPTAAIFVAASGDIGLGTATPSQDLHVRRTGTGATNLLLEAANSTPQAVQVRLRTGSTNRRVVGQDAAGANQSQLAFGDSGNFQFIAENDTNSVCLQFRDSDNAGDTACTFLDGMINCAVGTCP